MRLLYISTLYPHPGAPARAPHQHQLLAALGAMGHEVLVLAPVPWFRWPGLSRAPALPPDPGVTVRHPCFWYPPAALLPWHPRCYRWSLRRAFGRALADFRPEHVSIGFAFPDGCAMAPLCRERGVAYSLFVLGSDFRLRQHDPRLGPAVLAELRRAPLVCCPGEALGRDLAAAGVPRDRLGVFANGIAHDRFFPPPAGSPRRDVLFVGNLLPVKGIDRLLAAWARLPRPAAAAPLRLHLVGDGPERRRLEAQARRLGLAATVIFHGRLPHAQVAERLRQSRCLCLPSRSEGMANVILEALACGTPVVATAVGEAPALIRPGENGFLVPNDDTAPAALAAALGSVLERTWPPEALAAAVAGHTWEAAARTVSQFLETVSASR